MPQELTVGKLRQIIEHMHDDCPVEAVVSVGGQEDLNFGSNRIVADTDDYDSTAILVFIIG